MVTGLTSIRVCQCVCVCASRVKKTGRPEGRLLPTQLVERDILDAPFVPFPSISFFPSLSPSTPSKPSWNSLNIKTFECIFIGALYIIIYVCALLCRADAAAVFMCVPHVVDLISEKERGGKHILGSSILSQWIGSAGSKQIAFSYLYIMCRWLWWHSYPAVCCFFFLAIFFILYTEKIIPVRIPSIFGVIARRPFRVNQQFPL